MFYFVPCFSVILFALDRVMKDVVASERICNTGIAFGVQLPLWITLSLSGVLFVGMAILMVTSVQTKKGMNTGAIACVFFGALSNSIDRIVYGCVIDYIHSVPYFPWFNIADVSIFMGAVYFIFTYAGAKKEAL